jgi:hypothetical protein
LALVEIILTLLMAGKATFYGDGIFEQVVTYRQGIGQIQPCGECIGYVALLEPEHIGTKVWLRRPGQTALGPFLVVDCGPQDAPRKAALKARGWAVDVDPALAAKWDMHGPVDVEVLRAERRETPCRLGVNLPCD